MISILLTLDHYDIEPFKNLGLGRDIVFESEIGLRHGVYIVVWIGCCRLANTLQFVLYIFAVLYFSILHNHPNVITVILYSGVCRSELRLNISQTLVVNKVKGNNLIGLIVKGCQ